MELPGSDGLRLRAEVSGPEHGRPVVLLHGGGQTRHSWGTTGRLLAARGWRAHAVDLRGHGDSDWAPDGDYRLEAFAADVRSLCATLEGLPVLVGASLGGMASLLAIGEAPAPVAAALVLVDVAPRIEASGADRIGDFMRTHMETGFASLEEAADAVAAYNPNRRRPSDLGGLRKNLRQRPDGRWAWHWDPRFISGKDGSPDETRASIIDPDRLEAAARHLELPVLLVRGRVSDLLSKKGAERFLQVAPHAEFVDVAGAGHMVAGDRNDLFNEAILSFLDRLAAPPG